MKSVKLQLVYLKDKGKLWINVLNFKQKIQPIKPMVDNPFLTKIR